MESSLNDLNQKLDALTAQVEYLTGQARIAEQAREARDDLVGSAMPIVSDAMRLATRELEEVQDYIQPADLARMLKKLIVHLPQLEQLLDLLDAGYDLVDTAMPVVKLGLDTVTQTLDGLDRKGYFALARGAGQIADRAVGSLSEEDLGRLGDSVEPMLDVVKDLAKPEVITFLRDTVQEAEKEVQKPVDASLGGLARQMRDPDTRRGLALTLRVLQVIGRKAAADRK